LRKISEISLVAINTQDVFLLELENFGTFEKSNIEKICVYPMATIMPQVSCITGLDNYNLTGPARFEKSTVDLLNIFLDCLPSPVCLVAHNGNLYDFPLCKAELEKAGGKLGSKFSVWTPMLGLRNFSKLGGSEDRGC
jgi:three prime repair exonuclease-1